MHSAGRPGEVAGPGSSAPLASRYLSLFGVGRGGMGLIEVALARGPQGFERIVALKRLLPEATRERRHADMFLREARLAAQLQHPNVVHAFDFGELGGEYFLAMEYIEGETLARVVDVASRPGRGVDPVLAAHILALACDGLHAAHELCDTKGTPLNVVHRDVSPNNVMVSYEGQVKLLDFGVAKIDALESLTKTGEIKGKTRYMSPEQAMGDPLDRRSDLYSVGALLYECLTGRKMWEGSDMDVLRHLAIDEAPRLEVALLDAPSALCRLYARLVSRDPAGRPETARQVADELRAFVATFPYRPDTSALKAMMAAHFSEEIARRREALRTSLFENAPHEAEALQRALLGWAGTPSSTGMGGSSHVASVSGHERASGGPEAPPLVHASRSPAPPPMGFDPQERAKAWWIASITFVVIAVLAGSALVVYRVVRRGAGAATEEIEPVDLAPQLDDDESVGPMDAGFVSPQPSVTLGPVPVLPPSTAP